MNFALMSKLLMVPIKRVCVPKASMLPQMKRLGAGIGIGFGGQLQQVRRHAPICGPPRFPMSTAQRFLIGWGSLIFMMIIPFWALFQMPRWSALHNNLPWGEEPEQVSYEEKPTEEN